MEKEETMEQEITNPPEGYTQKCECGGNYKLGLDVWQTRVRCEKCGDWYDL